MVLIVHIGIIEMEERNDLAAISRTFDQAFATSISGSFEKIREALGEARDGLIARHSGDNIAQLEIAKCELERLLVASIKSNQDWKSSFEIYKSRKTKGFQTPVRHYLVFQTLLDAEIPQNAKEEVAALCKEIKKDLEDLCDGCGECLQQLRDKMP